MCVQRYGRNGAMEEHQPRTGEQLVETDVRKMEEEVREKYKVKGEQKCAYKGRSEPLGWRIVQTSEKYQPRKRGEGCWARIYSWFREHNQKR